VTDRREQIRILQEVSMHAAKEAIETLKRVADTLPTADLTVAGLINALSILYVSIETMGHAVKDELPKEYELMKRRIRQERATAIVAMKECGASPFTAYDDFKGVEECPHGS
jgi:hypothetical protein